MSLLQVNTIRNKTGTGSPSFDRGITVTGTSDLGTVRISSGIVTATSGIVTYYGDGRYLQNISSSISNTTINSINISGVATITSIQSQYGVFSGILTTVNVSVSSSITAQNYYGNGSNLSGIVTSLVAGTNITLSESTGRITINSTSTTSSRWGSTTVGIHTLLNVGIGTTNPTSKLTVLGNTYTTGNSYVTGVTTSVGGFVGDLIGTATTSTTSTNSNNTNITNDTSAVSTHYVTFVSNVSGNRPQKVSSTGLTFVPSTSSLTVAGPVSIGSSLTSASATFNGATAINGATTITGTTSINGNLVLNSGYDIVADQASFTGTITGVGATFSGTVTAQDFNSLSDVSLKSNIIKIDNALEKINQLEGVHYIWNNTNKPGIGLIAQEVEKVFPEIVTEIDGIKTLGYDKLVAVLIEAVKELKLEIEELKSNK